MKHRKKFICSYTFFSFQSYNKLDVVKKASIFSSEDINRFLFTKSLSQGMCNTPCGSSRIFLSLRFYVKSMLENLEVVVDCVLFQI